MFQNDNYYDFNLYTQQVLFNQIQQDKNPYLGANLFPKTITSDKEFPNWEQRYVYPKLPKTILAPSFPEYDYSEYDNMENNESEPFRTLQTLKDGTRKVFLWANEQIVPEPEHNFALDKFHYYEHQEDILFSKYHYVDAVERDSKIDDGDTWTQDPSEAIEKEHNTHIKWEFRYNDDPFWY